MNISAQLFLDFVVQKYIPGIIASNVTTIEAENFNYTSKSTVCFTQEWWFRLKMIGKWHFWTVGGHTRVGSPMSICRGLSSLISVYLQTITTYIKSLLSIFLSLFGYELFGYDTRLKIRQTRVRIFSYFIV